MIACAVRRRVDLSRCGVSRLEVLWLQLLSDGDGTQESFGEVTS